MKFKNVIFLIIGKIVLKLLRFLRVGSGSTWPGHIILFLNKNFIKQLLSVNKNLKTVFVTGTNGKTTTCSILTYILKHSNFRVFNNAEGANLLNGVATAIINNCRINGKINYDVAVFEIDENTLHLVTKQISPNIVIILNLFRDQLDRYGETDIIVNKWKNSLMKLDKKTKIYLNGDDPQVSYLGNELKAKIVYFGLANDYLTNEEIKHDVDSIYCPKCQRRLFYKGISYSHLGNFFCVCGFQRPQIKTINIIKKDYQISGIFNFYNITAATLALNDDFLIPIDKIKELIRDFKPSFGRQERIKLFNKYIYFYLAKNPVGLNQSIDLLLSKINKKRDVIWFILNDRIPDGTDISWIWDVEIEKLKILQNKIFVSGDRTYDMALRLKYADIKEIIPIKNLKEAMKKIKENSEKNSNIFILPTYTAMLEVRKILIGRKFL